MNLDLLGLQLISPLANPEAINFRPPHWPPPANWPPIVDAHGSPQCVYSDSTWPLDVWAGKPLKINFGDGNSKRGMQLDRANADLLRQCTVWFLWGPNGCRNPLTLDGKVGVIKHLFAVCAGQGIVASDLQRFDAVIDQVAASFPQSKFAYAVSILHELLDAREYLGFCLLERDGLARLVRLAPNHETQQTPYIPPRIWSYQLTRIRECLMDYVKMQVQVEECFAFCLDAYAQKYGSLKRAMNSGGNEFGSPFQDRNHARCLDFTRFRRHKSTSSSKLLECQRAQLV